MKTFLRILFFLLIVRPLVLFLLGVNLYHRERLPHKGPAILVANHNSHLDTLILMSLFPLKDLCRLRPVAAADYFLKNRAVAWFSRNIIGIIPIQRKKTSAGEDPLKPVMLALKEKAIVIFYPEGTRGEPERLDRFKSGIAHVVTKHPDIPVTPIFLQGTGRALPKGEALLVPFVVDVRVGEPLYGGTDRKRFLSTLEALFAGFVALIR